MEKKSRFVLILKYIERERIWNEKYHKSVEVEVFVRVFGVYTFYLIL